MKINWSVRLKNRTFLAALLALAVTFVYDLLALLGVAPGVEQNAVLTLLNAALTVLAALGVIVDPTTQGMSDSERALAYGQAAPPAKDAGA